MKMIRAAVTGIVAVSVALLGAGAAGAATAGGAQPTSIPSAVQAQIQSAPASVQAWARGIADKGGKIEKFTYAAYKLKAKPGATGAVKPDALPSGCGLYVLLVAPNAHNGGALESDNLTDCGHQVEQEIAMDSGIAIVSSGDPYEIAEDYDNNHVVEYFTLNYSYGCHGSKNEAFKTVTTGFVETLGGDEYEADAYDDGIYACTVPGF
jgi:hypothetical protein